MMITCPMLFSEKENSDSEQLQLTLYLMDEVTKGEASELHLYLKMLPRDLEFFYFLDEADLQECQDEEQLELALDLRADV